ncbi:hypothetical protein HSX11_02440 [Oxalobacteraceae bacterium]|nr:hypothetical protein [Oxalobacteraceae bacterium]
MTSKKHREPSILDALKAMSPDRFKKRPPPAPTPAPTNFDFMSTEERHAASSKGGQTTQRRLHAADAVPPEIARQFSELGDQWEKAVRVGADTTDIKKAIQEIVQRCFRDGVPNKDAVIRLNKYANSLRVQQQGESVHVTLRHDVLSEIVVKGN